MSLKMSMLTVLMLLSKTVSFLKGPTCFASPKTGFFEKDFLSNKATSNCCPYKVVTSSQDLEDIDLSKNYVLKTATGGYDGHGQKVIRSADDLEEANALS